MNVLKLSFFLLVMCLSIVEMSAQKPTKDVRDNRNTITATNGHIQVNQRTGVYPNPFGKSFTVFGYRGVLSVALLDGDREDVSVNLTFNARGVLVEINGDTPAGSYTVVITFKDGSFLELPIEKL